MSIKEDIEKVQKKVDVIEGQSLAMELLKDYKKTNKRLFIIWIITFLAFIGLLGYTIWLLNDIGTIESDTDTIDIQDVKNIDNSHIKIGNDVWEKSN